MWNLKNQNVLYLQFEIVETLTQYDSNLWGSQLGLEFRGTSRVWPPLGVCVSLRSSGFSWSPAFFGPACHFKQVMPARRQRLFAQLLSFTPTSGHPGVLLALHKHAAGCHLSFGLHERNPNVQVGEVRRRRVLPSARSLHCTYCGEERHFPDASARRQAVFGGVTKASVWYLQAIFQQSGST